MDNIIRQLAIQNSKVPGITFLIRLPANNHMTQGHRFKVITP
jgi:hypothetical protein